ncbi:MAG: hypothetical protein JSV88_22525 [Candidatus Aminicenantes bacterium]|nr:MAG: hypothetical protein JSV88_22525 [Candidatus Aminicenantes bacterium]
MRYSMNLHEQILECIDKYINPLTLYEILHLKTNTSINLISFIIKESNKTVNEAVLVFRTVVRYLWKNSGPLQEFIKENSDLICKTAIEKKAQSNLPGRALPLFEIFEKKIQAPSISVIELGASYGLIGRCLLNPTKVMEKKNAYFSPGQQVPQNPRPIDYYLGIELAPPDKEWVLAGEWHPILRERIKNFLHDIPTNEKFKLLKGNAFGFSKLKTVKDIAFQPSTLVVLTSFMLYQYDDKKQKRLRDEILKFTGGDSRHWINQDINVSSQECFIQFDGEKIIQLNDSTCRSWKWLK